MALVRTNTELDGQITGQTPDAGGDDFLVIDHNREMSYAIGKPVETLINMSYDTTDDFQIISGGFVTDGGSGTVDISACIAIGKDADGNHKIIEIPALTGVTLPSGWNDTRDIWVIAEHLYVATGPTRTHDETSESYNYQMIDSYLGSVTSDNLFVDADPTGSQVVLGKFTMNGTTFTSNDADANGRSIQWKSPSVDEWRADTHAGFGSTNTHIPYYSNIRVNDVSGGSFSVTNDGTSGCEFDINIDGLYYIGAYKTSSSGGNGAIGISLNSTQLTVTIIAAGFNAADRLALSVTGATAGLTHWNSCSWVGYLKAGDTVRPHTDAEVPNASPTNGIQFKRIA